jgi:starch synthase (maltosyl-transferring)
MIGRFPITDIAPTLNFGDEFLPTKGYVGEWIAVRANITREGHNKLGTLARFYNPKGKLFREVPMREIWPGTDRYEAWFAPDSEGKWTFEIGAYDDELGTWLHDAAIKITADVESELMCQIGVKVLEKMFLSSNREATKELKELIKVLENVKLEPLARFETVSEKLKSPLLLSAAPKNLLTISERQVIDVEAEISGFASWYEFFPRSEGARINEAGKLVSGNFLTAIKSLDRVAKMGFDILYLPPIHPIGKTFRKGRNNSLLATADDPGVPWAIGSAEGGHENIHPDLGTIGDFDKFIKAAKELKIKVALDLALQASPDHPWVKAHPNWFTTRPDGSIAFAENPPKKYQDIYPLNFDLDFVGLVKETIKIINFWVSHGVEIFRVDNPHTKPINFWQQVIAAVKDDNPKIIFLSESFTKPTMMHDLAKAGFTSSYTYFTWRVSKDELANYGREVSQETAHFFRPNFWVNTPDILPYHLQGACANVFKMRALLAATLTPLWGMYAGYELMENQPLAAGKEEYLDSEKYEIKVRDFATAQANGKSIAPFIAQINTLRKKLSPLKQLRTLAFHPTDNDRILVYSKSDGEKRVIVVVNLNPDYPESAYINFDIFYLGNKDKFEVVEQFTTEKSTFVRNQFIELRPEKSVGYIFEVLN